MRRKKLEKIKRKRVKTTTNLETLNGNQKNRLSLTLGEEIIYLTNNAGVFSLG